MSEETNNTPETELSRRNLIKLSAAGLLAGAVTLATPSIPPVYAAEKRMKIILVNGSPNKNGCTYTALDEVAATLKKEGLEADIFHTGKEIVGCRACRSCAKLGHCVINDPVNEFLELAKTADGFVFGTPVHFAAAGGGISSFMARAIFVARQSKADTFYLKPAATVVTAKRSGTTSAFDQLNKFYTHMEMPVISTRHWNEVFGADVNDLKRDLVGMQTMRDLARNMAWFLRCKEAALAAGVAFPEREQHA